MPGGKWPTLAKKLHKKKKLREINYLAGVKSVEEGAHCARILSSAFTPRKKLASWKPNIAGYMLDCIFKLYVGFGIGITFN